MIKELHPGDTQISAAGWNEMRAIAQGLTPGQQQYQSGQRSPAYVTIKNNTGSDLPAFSVVKIDGAMYTRTGDEFINQAAQNGVELNGVTPAAATDTIAITQAACKSGGIVKAMISGATACKVYKTSNAAYSYADVTAGQSGYLTGSNTPSNIRVLWIASGTGNKEAYVLIDYAAAQTPEYFVINAGNDGSQTAANNYALYTKGSLHYIEYDVTAGVWVPMTGNETAPTSAPYTRPAARLAICQADAPNSAAEYKMPYYTPECNMGVAPDIDSTNPYVTLGLYSRCGVVLGEHKLSGKNYDYCITGFGSDSVKYEYQPVFIVYNVTANGTTGGGYTPYIEINNEQYDVDYPTTYTDGANYPDIYPYDLLTVQINCEAATAAAIDYPRDYPAGFLLAAYQSPGRGWDAITTPPGMQDAGLTLYQKTKTGAIT